MASVSTHLQLQHECQCTQQQPRGWVGLLRVVASITGVLPLDCQLPLPLLMLMLQKTAARCLPLLLLPLLVLHC